MSEFTDNLTEKAKAGIDSASAFLSDLPVIGDYRDKEQRREADRRLRASIAVSLESARKRIIAIERILLNKGKLTDLPYVDVAANRLQNLVDRIRTAASGYAGFFDMEKIQEPELEKLYQFDQRLAASVPEIHEKIDAMEQAITSGEDYSQSLVDLIQSLDEFGERLDHRKEAIRAVASDVSSLSDASSLDDMSSSSDA